MMYHSSVGGTGSGLADTVHDIVSSDMKIKNEIDIDLMPGPTLCDSIIAPINYVLSMTTYSRVNGTNMHMLLANESIYKLLHKYYGIEHPTFKQANQLISDMLANLVSTMMFPTTASSSTFNDLCTSLFPYSRTNYVTPANYLSPSIDHDLYNNEILYRMLTTKDYNYFDYNKEKDH